MHIEPGMVEPTKMAIGYVTAVGFFALAARSVVGEVIRGNILQLFIGAFVAFTVTFMSFEVLPHPTVGVSEVHLILGATLYLLFGFAPVAAGMAGALLFQGLLFEPADLAQYCMNVTTLLASLAVTAGVANRLIAPETKYVDIPGGQIVKLAMVFQGSVIAWVAFWVTLGQGVSVMTLQSLASFAGAYSLVVLAEIIASIGLLALLKLNRTKRVRLPLNPRLFGPQAA